MSRFAMCTTIVSSLLTAIAACAAEPVATGAPVVHDVLAAEAAGLAAVRYIPNDSRSAQIIVANRSDRPLTLRLPDAFAGVPVLAQMPMGGMGGMGGGMGGVGMGGVGMGGMGGAPQTTGGGAGRVGVGVCWVAREVYGPLDPRWVEFRTWMTVDAPRWLRDGYAAHGEAAADWLHGRPAARRLVRAGMDAVIDGSAGAAGGQFRVGPLPDVDGSFAVPAGRQRTFRFATVCLEYGKPEPSPRVPYRLVALESFSPDPRLPVVMAALAGGQVSQKTAQAAAWHIASGLSWERLAAERIDHAGGVPDEPYFAPGELAAARGLVAEADRAAAVASESASPTDE